jgi:hypothetical protein
MSFLSRLFSGGKQPAKVATSGPEMLHGRIADLQEAYRLAEADDHDGALAILDRLLALPEDTGAAAQRLRALLEQRSPTGLEHKNMGKDADGNHMLKLRVTLGGGMVPTMMAFRAQCLMSALVQMAQRDGDGAVDGPIRGSGAAMKALQQKARHHTVIVAEVLEGDVDNLVSSGALAYTMANMKLAEYFLAKAVAKDPKHETAPRMLQMAKQRIAEGH